MRQKLIWAGAVVLLVAGCGGSASHRVLPILSITERDFHISAPHQVEAGDVLVHVKNKGPVSHELMIIHAGSSRLPLRADGFTIDQHALRRRLVVHLEPEGPSVTDVVVHLAPGRYIVLCNMAGHAAAGMQTSFWAR